MFCFCFCFCFFFCFVKESPEYERHAKSDSNRLNSAVSSHKENNCSYCGGHDTNRAYPHSDNPSALKKKKKKEKKRKEKEE
jgi:hypothetical protein